MTTIDPARNLLKHPDGVTPTAKVALGMRSQRDFHGNIPDWDQQVGIEWRYCAGL
jgi:hypothetical protein